jgi:hypothetical protein
MGTGMSGQVYLRVNWVRGNLDVLSFGLEHDCTVKILFSLALDLALVLALALAGRRDGKAIMCNPLPLGSAFDSSNIGPTRCR